MAGRSIARRNRETRRPSHRRNHLTCRLLCHKEITKWAGARLERRAFITYAVEARFRRIADLTEPTTRAQFEVTREMLTGEDVTGCHALARRLREAGFEGLLTPSAADSAGMNLVIFEDRVLPDSRFGKPERIRERKGWRGCQ